MRERAGGPTVTQGPSLRPDSPFAAVLACFGLSGFAALVYETSWTRQFALVFGTSELAVATVLAAYMAGLAVGAAVAARLATAVRRPVLTYGVLELAVALAALAVPGAIRASMALCVALFGHRDAPPEAGGLTVALFYLACAFVILMVPTGLMGATLPLLARHAVRHPGEIGARVGVLYAANTAGAVLGTLAAAFVLLPRLGLSGTVRVAVAVNAAVFVIAALVARAAPALPPAGARAEAASRDPSPGPAGRDGAPAASTARLRLIGPVVLVSGTVSFTLEVLWTRLIGHVLGGSVFAFATMLASFLIGIACGSAAASGLATTPRRAARGLVLAQLGIALSSSLAFRVADELPRLAASLGAGLAGGLGSNAALAAVVLLPTTVCIGMTFPLAVRVLAAGGGDAGPASGRIYAWSTAGAVLGALGAGFFLVPLLGYAGTMTAAIALSVALAAAAAWLVEPGWRGGALAAGAAGVLLLLAPPATPWKLVSVSTLSPRSAAPTPFHLAVGRGGTVTLAVEHDAWRLRVNGLPEGVILPRHQNQASVLERWLGALPSLARPETRAMLVIGLGGGSALEAVSRTVTSIDVVEIEPEVVAANRLLSGRRAVDPLADPRLRIRLNDARNALALTDRRWDAIVSQPSYPWSAAAAHLYTREFFRLVRDRLAPAGVFVQWIELSYVDEPLLRTLVATLVDVFPHVRLYRPVLRSGLLFLASDRHLPVETDAARAIAASPGEFAWAGVQTAEDVAAALALDEAGTRRFAAGAPVTTDERNRFQTGAPRVLAAPLGTDGGDRLLAPLDPLPAVSRGLNRLYLIRRLIADGDVARARRLGETLADRGERLTAAGLVHVAERRLAAAAAALTEALRLEPGSREAHVALLRVQGEAALAPGVTRRPDRLDDPLAAVREGWQAEAVGDWGRLRALDERLAAAAPHDPVYPDAYRLRAAWRIESGRPELAVEALRLVDRVLPLTGLRGDLELRRRALRLLGGPRPSP
jgi:spermidine synthase